MKLSDRRVKIVATVGPSISSKDGLRNAIRAGMNVARLNFSHGTHEDHLKVIQYVRELSKELQAPVALLQDLQGPKIRVGKMAGGTLEMKVGEEYTFSTTASLGEGKIIPTDFKELPQSCVVGTKILLDDGLMEVRVTEVGKDFIKAKVLYGGILKDRKGMNLPGANLPVECMTEKDLADLEFGLANGVDYVALSFVRQGSDIDRLRELIVAKRPNTKIIAKIEMLEALKNLEEIIMKSDGVMVARGDLAVETGQSQLPGMQKKIIWLCNVAGIPVITATQMLDSMVSNPRPTRAEITDVANAVIDGSDALMLSAESASGKYPFKCIQTMHEIITEVEKTTDLYYDLNLEEEFSDIADSIAASACLTSLKLHASAIVCLTTTGKTATMISNFRPKAQIIAMTHQFETLNRMELAWGIQTFSIKPYKTVEEAMQQIESLLLSYGLVKKGDKIVLTLGMPVLEKAKTNTLRVYTVTGSGARLSDEELPLRCKEINPDQVFS